MPSHAPVIASPSGTAGCHGQRADGSRTDVDNLAAARTISMSRAVAVAGSETTRSKWFVCQNARPVSRLASHEAMNTVFEV